MSQSRGSVSRSGGSLNPSTTNERRPPSGRHGLHGPICRLRITGDLLPRGLGSHRANRAFVRPIRVEEERHEAIHEARKRCKKVRAALRVVRPVLDGYREAYVHFRDTTRIISDLRDATAHIETLDAIEKRRGPALDRQELGALRQAVVIERDRLGREQNIDDRLDHPHRRSAAGGARALHQRLNVWREDADELLEIRRGAWSYERLVDWAEGEQKALQRLQREGRVAVPANPDLEAIDDLVCDLVQRSFGD